MYYYDYWITNITTGIHYIGSHYSRVKIPVSGYGNSFSKEECKYMGSCTPLKADIKKYGKENFYKHIIEVYPTDNECRAEEGKLHELYDVSKNPLFYNGVKAGKEGFSNSGENHHGFSDIDWEGMSITDNPRYAKIREISDNSNNFGLTHSMKDIGLEPDFFDQKNCQPLWIEKKVLTPEEEFDKLITKDSVDSAVSTLTEKETKIIQMYYGLEPYSREFEFSEIGNEFNLGGSHMSQMARKSLIKLRHPSRSKFLLVERYEQMCETD